MRSVINLQSVITYTVITYKVLQLKTLILNEDKTKSILFASTFKRKNIKDITKYGDIYMKQNFNLSRPYPGQREKINLNFYVHTSLRCLKRFYEGIKGLHKIFWSTTKKCENKNLVSSEVSFTPWGEGASLALVGHHSIDGITIKILYGVDFLLHPPASHPIFSYWVG